MVKALENYSKIMALLNINTLNATDLYLTHPVFGPEVVRV